MFCIFNFFKFLLRYAPRFILLALIPSVLQASSLDFISVTPQIYSPKAYEAKLQYTGYVDVTTLLFSPSKSYQEKSVEKQLTYMFGAFDNNPSGRKASPKMKHQFTITSLENHADGYRIHYEYSGTILIYKKDQTFSFYLPTRLDDLWERSLVTNNGQTQYPCGGKDHPYEHYFWYYFAPKAPGCPLVEGVDYQQFTGQITISSNNTALTYPEYERLIHNEEITIDIIMGMDDTSNDHIPNFSQDINAGNFRRIRSELIENSYEERIWSDEEIIQLFGKRPSVYVAEFNKQTPKAKMRIRMYFGSSLNYSFRTFFRDSILQSSVTIYAGHSGLGDSLSIERITENAQLQVAPPTNRYQIYFFNGCASYPYYNAQYFDLKKTDLDPQGTKNLDIITNGLGTYFYAIPRSTMALVNGIDSWAMQITTQSYQEIIDLANSANLIAINGDEDNVVQ